MSKDFKVGAEVFENGSLKLMFAQDGLKNKMMVTGKQDLENLRDAVEEALEHLEMDRDNEDGDTSVTGSAFEGNKALIEAESPHMKTSIKLEDVPEIDGLAELLASAGSKESLL